MYVGSPALAGLKVVEFAHVIAGPLAGTLLADLGAEVVHVEDPGRGDPQRSAGPAVDGVHLWWKVSSRNKRSVTVNLRLEEGREVARELANWADVVIATFRTETLEKWGLDFASLRASNPQLVYLQISGYGARSSRRNEPGFGKVGEAMSGVVNVTGFPDGPPVHTGFSHGDSVSGLMGAFAVQAALYRKAHDPQFQGEWIDLALYESLYRLIEWQVIYYDQLDEVPHRAGNQLAVSPAAVVNTHRTLDGKWLTVTSGTPRTVSRVAALVGEPPEDYLTPVKQVARRQRLNELVGEWIAARPLEECMKAMLELSVVASPVYTVEDILRDATFRENGNIVSVEDPDLGVVQMQGVVPRMTNHPGQVRHTAPALGADNDLVFGTYLGRDAEALAALAASGAI